jgi:hypothetical protein
MEFARNTPELVSRWLLLRNVEKYMGHCDMRLEQLGRLKDSQTNFRHSNIQSKTRRDMQCAKRAEVALPVT